MFSCTTAQPNYSTITVQILYSLQLNCSYSNYTEAAATCSAAQQHSTFTVQILYKLYSLQLNCTYSYYTEAAATCSAAQHKRNCLAIFCSGLQLVVCNDICIDIHIHISDCSRNSHDWKRSGTTSQSYSIRAQVPAWCLSWPTHPFRCDYVIQ